VRLAQPVDQQTGRIVPLHGERLAQVRRAERVPERLVHPQELRPADDPGHPDDQQSGNRDPGQPAHPRLRRSLGRAGRRPPDAAGLSQRPPHQERAGQ
jgi:hypothetical protein